MKQRRPRDYDPYALERMPDQPPRNLDSKAPGRWAEPDALQTARRIAKTNPVSISKLVRNAALRSQLDYYAYLEQNKAASQAWQGWATLLDINIDPNRYGYLSRAQELYPQLYKSINTSYWHGISDEERQELLKRQAAAQELVGFERNTEKFFIGDVQVEGLPGPGEEPSATELLTEFDTDYALRRKAYHQRMREREEIRQGKRKRYNQYTASRDEANCPILGLPSVVEGIKNTPALRAMMPEAAALSAQREKEQAESLELRKPLPDSLGMRRLREGRKRRVSYRDLPLKNTEPLAPRKQAPVRTDAGSTPARAAGVRSLQYARHFRRQALQVGTTNKYGLKSRSELDYPQAYAPVASEMWTGLTEEERRALYKTQAVAQEKAGFEKGAPKFFIEDFDPHKARAPKVRDLIINPAAQPRIEPSTASLLGGTAAVLAAGAFAVCWLLDVLTWKLIAVLAVAFALGIAMAWPRGKGPGRQERRPGRR